MSPEQWIPATWGDAHAGDYVKVNGIEFRVTDVDHPRITCKRSGSTAQAKIGIPPLDKAIELYPLRRTGDGFAVFDGERAALLSGGPVPVESPRQITDTEATEAAGLTSETVPAHDPKFCVLCKSGGHELALSTEPDPLTIADAQREEVRATADAVFTKLADARIGAINLDPTLIMCGPVAPGTEDLTAVEQFKTDLPALRALRPLLDLVEQFEPAIKEVSGALAGAGREVIEAYSAALREISDVVYRAQFALPEPTPGDMTGERAAYKVAEAAGMQPKVIGRVLALSEIIKHLVEMHVTTLPTRDPDLTGVEYRGQLHDLHFVLHGGAQHCQSWEERGTVPHTHAVMDRPMR